MGKEEKDEKIEKEKAEKEAKEKAEKEAKEKAEKEKQVPPGSQAFSQAINPIGFEKPNPADSPAFGVYLEKLNAKVDKVLEKLFPPDPPPPGVSAAPPEKKSFIRKVLDYEIY